MRGKKPNYYKQLTRMGSIIATLKTAADGKPQSILALSDGNKPGKRSAASLIAEQFKELPQPSSTAIHRQVTASARTESQQDSPADSILATNVPLLTIIQSDIMPNWLGGSHLPQNIHEARIEFMPDDNLSPTDIVKRSHDAHGFDLIIGVSLLCLCSTDLAKTPVSQNTLCGGMECSAESILAFFLAKILPNLKDHTSAAILSGACFYTEAHLKDRYRNKLKQNMFSKIWNRVFKHRTTPNHDSIKCAAGRNNTQRSITLAKQAVRRYHHGLDVTRSAVDLFNRSPYNQGFTATMQTLELDEQHPAVGFPGYAVTIKHS